MYLLPGESIFGVYEWFITIKSSAVCVLPLKQMEKFLSRIVVLKTKLVAWDYVKTVSNGNVVLCERTARVYHHLTLSGSEWSFFTSRRKWSFCVRYWEKMGKLVVLWVKMCFNVTCSLRKYVLFIYLHH